MCDISIDEVDVSAIFMSQVHQNVRKVIVPVQHGPSRCFLNFQHVSKMWKPLVEARRKTHPEEDSDLVPCEMSEDETGIVANLQYDEQTDSVVGSCGWQEEGHTCDPDFTPVIGDDWDNLVRIIQTCVRSTYARVIMVNPLVKWLKPAVVYTNCTCNKFKHSGHRGDVVSQWSTTLHQFDKHLTPLGFSFTGRGSDGDGRRYILQHSTWFTNAVRLRKLLLAVRRMQKIWRRLRGPRARGTYHASPTPILPFTGCRPISLSSMGSARGFTFACLAKIENDRIVSFTGCHSQDSIHKSKRLDIPLQWASKDMIIGDYTANALHLFVAREHMTAEQVRGLRGSDLRRDDRQNFAAVVRRSSNSVRGQLQRLQSDTTHPTATQGTVAVYYMIHLYLLIFFSKKNSLADRFEYGGYVCHFFATLAGIHKILEKQAGSQLKKVLLPEPNLSTSANERPVCTYVYLGVFLYVSEYAMLTAVPGI